MKAAILKYVKENPRASFVNLARDIPGFTGDFEFGPASHRPLVYWQGLSEEAVSAVGDLLRDKKLYLAMTQVLTYAIDGGMLNLPVARSARQYSTKRWLPVVLCEGPPKVGKRAAKRR